MVNTLYRTGRSGVINTANDFSCAIVTSDDELLASVESLPIHVMSGPDIMARSLRDFHEQFKRGDAFLHNSPYHGNSHAADHTLLVPVVDDDGVHQFTVVAKAHQADCGNSLPTTYMSRAVDVYQEGALIFPGVKVQENYEDCDDILRMCRMRFRVPDQWWGDYLALLGAVRVGERALLDLGAELGWEALQQYAQDWFDYSEMQMGDAIQKLPSGEVSATTVFDGMPDPEEELPITATVRVAAEAGRVTVDLRENPDCTPNGLNLTEATSRTAAMIGVFNSLGPGIPLNAGSFRRLDVLLRENCVVGIPRHPTSCSLATTGVAERAGNVVQAAMAKLGEGIGMAEAGYVMPPCDAVISGVHPLTGTEYINQIFFASSGGGAGPVEDGFLGLGPVGAAGVVRREGVEMSELRYPMHVHTQRILVDSEGPGRRRGAPGNEVEYGPVGTQMRSIYSAGGSRQAALGVRGGGPGSAASAAIRRGDGSVEPLPADMDLLLNEGESVISRACGGGGYGNPWEREVERVLDDLHEGWITQGRAEAVYGVVTDATGGLDGVATAHRRAELARGSVSS
jgi:N-methylhydantoinase B